MNSSLGQGVTVIVQKQGVIRVNNLETTENIAQIRSILGYMPQRFSLYQDLSVEQNLRFFAELFQVPREEREREATNALRAPFN